MLTTLISPTPPIASEELLHIGAGLRFVDSPTDYLKELRERHGDTFLLDAFGFQLLLTFSATGLESLYALEEQDASFGLATFDMIGFMTPTEVLLDADIQMFYQLLVNRNMPSYIASINRVVDMELERWGESGELDIFDAIRTLEQRVGYALWIAEEASDDSYWPQLKENFDVLDQERAFVDPQGTLETIKSNKAKEREAIENLFQLIQSVIKDRETSEEKGHTTLDYLQAKFSGSGKDEQLRKVIHNCINANQGFLSNLYAAIAWVVVNLLQYSDVKEKVAAEMEKTRQQFGEDYLKNADALNGMVYLEQVMMESIRLAQRSLTLRKVLKPVELNDGEKIYTVQPGIYIATMLSVTNTQTEALARFDPDHYDKNKLVAALPVGGKHSISTFGHGKHSCPAQRFSHHMVKIVVAKLLQRFDFEPLFDNPQPSHKQMGGVSRPESECRALFSVKF